MAAHGTHEKPTLHFYADDGRFGGANPDLIQSYLDTFLEFFAAVGLEVNASKTVRGSVEEIVREVLPCDREHGPAIRKRHMGCH